MKKRQSFFLKQHLTKKNDFQSSSLLKKHRKKKKIQHYWGWMPGGWRLVGERTGGSIDLLTAKSTLPHIPRGKKFPFCLHVCAHTL